MAYNVTCVADFGASNSGLTINGKLFDATGTQTGGTITSGFVELVTGLWLYTLSAPDGHSGAFVMYSASDATLRRVVIVAPRETENADAKASAVQTAITTAIDALNDIAVADILSSAVETGHSLQTVLRALYAAIRGRSVANSATDPTTITYYAPDNSTARIVHTLTDTERTVS